MEKTLPEISYAHPPQKIFRSVEHYRAVRTAILNALSTKKAKTSSKNESYMINRLVVSFTARVKHEEIYIDHINGQVVLEAPLIKKETTEHQKQRRLSYLSNLVRSVEAISTIGITHIYLTLDDKGRRQLEKKTKVNK
jgi:hypothetical protein